MLAVNSAMAAKVIGLWWVLSLLVVRGSLELPLIAPLLEAVRQAVPAVGMYAHASGFEAATTGFYIFYLVSTPLVAGYYFRFIELKRPLSRAVRLIMWMIMFVCLFFMTIGVDLGPTDIKGFLRTFHVVLTSAWFGSSFVFLMFCHCLLSAVAAIAKDRRDFS